MFRKILVPLDGSQLSERALHIAQRILPLTNPELFLVHVVDPSREAAAHMHRTYLDGVAEASRKHITEESLKSQSGTKVIPVLLHGDPATEIINFAQQNDVSLIIMSTRNRTGIRRWALGSVSEKVYRQTMCPCILIGADGESKPIQEVRTIGRILVPIGRTGSEKSFLSYVNAFDARIVTQVIFLQAVPPVVSIDEVEYSKVANELTKSAYVDMLEQNRKEEALKHLSIFTNAVKTKGMLTTALVVIGSTVESILKYAKETNIDLITLPAEGQSAFGNWILGKLAKTLLREGKTPVLIVKPLKTA